MRACRDFQYDNKNDICYFSPLAMWNLARLKLNPYLKLPLLPDTLCRRGGIKRYRDPSVCLSQPRLYARWRRGAAQLPTLSARWLPAAGRPPEMCRLRTRPRTELNCHRRGHIVSPPRGGNLYLIRVLCLYRVL